MATQAVPPTTFHKAAASPSIRSSTTRRSGDPHTFRAGVNFVRNDVTELGYGVLTSGLVTMSNINAVYAGTGPGTRLQIRYPSATSQPLALYTLGGYIQDDWKISPTVTLNMGLRIEHYSNPVCQHDCFATLSGPFSTVSNSIDTPYNQLIQTGGHQAYRDYDTVNWSPRVGLAWNVGGKGRTGDSRRRWDLL